MKAERRILGLIIVVIVASSIEAFSQCRPAKRHFKKGGIVLIAPRPEIITPAPGPVVVLPPPAVQKPVRVRKQHYRRW